MSCKNNAIGRRMWNIATEEQPNNLSSLVTVVKRESRKQMWPECEAICNK